MIKKVSKPFEHEWETNKHKYEGYAFIRTWDNGYEDIVKIPTRQRIKNRSKYMPHQGKQEMNRRKTSVKVSKPYKYAWERN